MIYTYADASRVVSHIAAGMRERLHLLPGTRVAVFMPNRPEYLLLLFAAWHAGLAVVPINSKLHAKELGWILTDCTPGALFTAPQLAAAAATASAASGVALALIEMPGPSWQALLETAPLALTKVAADDLSWLFYTSGTTGRPKGAMLSHANLLAMTTSYFADVDVIAAEDCMIHCAPLSHGSGLYALPHVARGAIHVIPASGQFDVHETLELISHWPRCTFFLAPTMVRRLVEAAGSGNDATRNIKTIVYGGGPMYVEGLLRAMQVLGPKLVQIYGQGEAPMTITAMSKDVHLDRGHPQYLKRLASVGLPRTDVEVLVVDADDRPVPTGAVGEIIVNGSVVMSGYWRNEEASAATLRGGWLHTGDLGMFDEHGFLTLVGRSKDVIISGGSNIYPREVEDVLLLHEGVAEAAIVGHRHPEWGEEVVAFVVCRPGHTVESAHLDRLCLDNLARYKRPRRYVFVPELPKNNYGKVLKTVLRAAAEADLSNT